MTKNNNNKLKVLILFFIGGLTLNHHTMENKKTYSQRQSNEDDQITQIDTTSKKRIKTNNHNPANNLVAHIPGEPVRGFVNELADTDMAQGTLYIGEYHHISHLFPGENTIGQNTVSVQRIDPNIVYKIKENNLEKDKGLGPFVPPKIVKISHENPIEAKEP